MGTNRHIEAIAQSRLITRVNTEPDLRADLGLTEISGSNEGVHSDIQWEIDFSGSGRPDFLAYDSDGEETDDPNPTAHVAEVKISENRGSDQKLQEQVDKYETWIDLNAQAVPAVVDFAAADYQDTFLVGCSPDDPKMERWEVRPDPIVPGVIVATQTLGSQPTTARKRYDGESSQPCLEPSNIAPGTPDFPAPAPDPVTGITRCAEVDDLDRIYQRFAEFVYDAREYIVESAASGPAVVAKLGQAASFWANSATADNGDERALDCGEPPARTWGDPRLETLDGIGFDMQTVGEFELLRAPQIDLAMQTRFLPWQNSQNVSVVDSVSFTLNGYTLELDSDNDLIVEGNPLELEVGELLYLNGGAMIIRSESGYLAITSSLNEGMATITWEPHNLAVQVSADVPTSGLLGNNNGRIDDDFRTPDGLADPNGGRRADDGWIYGRFSESWRVRPADSLFTYAAGESTQTFTDKAFPRRRLSIDNFDPADVQDATNLCIEAEEGTARDGCVLDLLATGGDEFLDMAMNTKSAPLSYDRAVLTSESDVSETFESTIPLNLAPSDIGQDAALGAFAGPLRADRRYGFEVPVRASHSRVRLAFDLIVIGDPANTPMATISVGDFYDQIRIGRTTATSLGASLVSTETGTTAGGQKFTRYRYVASDLPSEAALLAIEIATEGISRFSSNGVGIDNLDISLVDGSPSDELDLAVDDQVHPNDEPAGVIQKAGGQRIYRFSVAETGDLAAIDLIEGRSLPDRCESWTLAQLKTGRIFRDPCTLPSETFDAGPYELTVTPPRRSNLPYEFGFQLSGDVGPSNIDLGVVGADWTEAQGIAGGPPVLLDETNAHTYQIDVASAGILSVDLDCQLTVDDCYEDIGLRDANGVGVSYGDGTQSAAVQPGIHELVINPRPGKNPYRLRVKVVARGAEAHQLAIGGSSREITDPDVGTVTEDEAFDRFVFDVPAGGGQYTLSPLSGAPQWVDPGIGETHQSRICSHWRIGRTDDGFDTPYSACLHDVFMSEGQYELLVQKPASLPDGEFPYAFELLSVDDRQTDTMDLAVSETITLSPDATTGLGVVENSRSVDVYNLTTLSEAVIVDVEVDCQIAGDCPGWSAFTNADGRLRLLPGQTEEVFVASEGGGRIEYDLTLTVTPVPTVEIGEELTGTFFTTDEFFARNNEVINLAVTDEQIELSYWSARLNAENVIVYDNRVGDYLDYWDGSPRTFSEGSYSLIVLPHFYRANRNYGLLLERTTDPVSKGTVAATSYAERAASSATLEAFNSIHTYTVDVDSDADYQVDLTPGYWFELFDSAGEQVWVYGPTRLASGEYELRVGLYSGVQNPALNYTVTIAEPRTPDRGSLLHGEEHDSESGDGLGILANADDVDEYTFEVPEGGQLLSLQTSGVDPCGAATLLSSEAETPDLGDGGFDPFFDMPQPLECSELQFLSFYSEGSYTLRMRAGRSGFPDPFGESTSTSLPVEYSVRLDNETSWGLPEDIDLPTSNEVSTGDAVRGTVAAGERGKRFAFALTEEQASLYSWVVFDNLGGCAELSARPGWGFQPGGGCESRVVAVRPGEFDFSLTGDKAGGDYNWLIYLSNTVPDHIRSQPDGGGGGGDL